MEPSLIRLETPEEVQLAYAQAASAIEFITLKAGHDGLKRIMDRMVQTKAAGAGESIKEVLGLEFPAFEEQWTAFLSSKELRPLHGTSLPHYRVREGEMDGERMDLEEIKSLVARNRAHLGDRLKARGRMGAAVLEYQRALSETRDAVPVMYRLSGALILLDRDEEALNILKRALELAPDHPTPYVQLGRIYLKMKDYHQAKWAFEVSLQINPFNPEIHIGLYKAYRMLGDEVAAARERDIAYRLGR
jgi:tetratricopeptide (TPR) repeat protein